MIHTARTLRFKDACSIDRYWGVRITNYELIPLRKVNTSLIKMLTCAWWPFGPIKIYHLQDHRILKCDLLLHRYPFLQPNSWKLRPLPKRINVRKTGKYLPIYHLKIKITKLWWYKLYETFRKNAQTYNKQMKYIYHDLVHYNLTTATRFLDIRACINHLIIKIL